MTTAAILGADSMLGREIQRQLRGPGVEVLTVGRSPGNDLLFDIEKPFQKEASAGMQADTLFHCAASFCGDDKEGSRTNFLTNSYGSVNVIELIESLKIKTCIYAGSVSSVKGADNTTLSSYGLSKALGESILEWGMIQSGGRFCSLRFSQLYDTEGRCCAHQPWFGRIIAYAMRGKALRLPPSDGAPRNFLHVSDAARLIIHAAEQEISGIWPLCHYEELDTQHIAELAYSEFNNGGEIIIDDSKLPFRPFRFPKSDELYDRLREKPRITMAQGMAMIHHAGYAGDFGPIDVN